MYSMYRSVKINMETFYTFGFHGIGENKNFINDDEPEKAGTLLHKYKENINIIEAEHPFYGVKFLDYVFGLVKNKNIKNRFSYYNIHNPWSNDLEFTKKSILKQINDFIHKDEHPVCDIYSYSQGTSVAIEFVLKWAPEFFPKLKIREVHIVNGFYLDAMIREKLGQFSRLINYQKATSFDHLKEVRFYLTYVKDDHLVSSLQLYELIKLLCDCGIAHDHVFIKIVNNSEGKKGHFVVQPFVAEEYISLEHEDIKNIMPKCNLSATERHNISAIFGVFCVIYVYYAL